MKDADLTRAAIGAAIEIHRSPCPGLLEAAYEERLARQFAMTNIPFERDKPIPLIYRDLRLECGYRLDFLINQRMAVEINSIESFAPIHESVMLAHLRLSESPLGLLINCPNSERWHTPIRVALSRRPKRQRRDAECAEERRECLKRK